MSSLKLLKKKLNKIKIDYPIFFDEPIKISLGFFSDTKEINEQIYTISLREILEELNNYAQDSENITHIAINNIHNRLRLLQFIEYEIEHLHTPAKNNPATPQEPVSIVPANLPADYKDYISKRPISLLTHYKNGKISIDEIIYPEGEPSDKPWAYYENNADYYCELLRNGNKKTIKIHHMTDEMRYMNYLTHKYIEYSENFKQDDQVIIEIVLQQIEFINLHKAAYLKFSTLLSDAISFIFQSISLLSEQTKNRNLDLIPATGWSTFELASNLLSSYDYSSDMYDYVSFRNLMLDKIFNEDLPEIKKLIEQIHDTKCFIGNKKNKLIRKFALFEHNPEILKNISDLQLSIENSIRRGSDAKTAAEKLRGIISDHKLGAQLEHTLFLCATVKNLYSLKKVIYLIERLPEKKLLSSEQGRYAFLFGLIQIGEYLTHKKLSNKFRHYYKNIPWEIFQIIRDYMVHQEENQNYKVIENILKNSYNEIRFEGLLDQLQLFKQSIQMILEKEFKDSNNKFINDFLQKYWAKDNQDSTLILEDDIEFFLVNLSASADRDICAQWEKILRGEATLPFNKQNVGMLKRTWMKNWPIEIKKRYALIFNQLEDIRDQGDCIINLSEKKKFKESTIYKKNRQHWDNLLLARARPTPIDLIELDNFTDEDITKIPDIEQITDKISGVFYKNLFCELGRELVRVDVFKFICILEDVPEIQIRWLNVLDKQTRFPANNILQSDLQIVLKKLGRIDFCFFQRFSFSLRAYNAPLELPMFENLKQKFSYNNRCLNNAEIINFSIYSISSLCEIIQNDLLNEKEVFAVLAENKKFYSYFFKSSTSNNKLIGIQKENLLSILSLLIDERPALAEKLAQRLYEMLQDNSILRDALLYHFTVGLSLLKKIVKFPEVEETDFIFSHYEIIFKCRNDLTHGNYIQERIFGAKYKPQIIFKLLDFIPQMLNSLREIKKRLPDQRSPNFNDSSKTSIFTV